MEEIGDLCRQLSLQQLSIGFPEEQNLPIKQRDGDTLRWVVLVAVNVEGKFSNVHYTLASMLVVPNQKAGMPSFEHSGVHSGISCSCLPLRWMLTRECALVEIWDVAAEILIATVKLTVTLGLTCYPLQPFRLVHEQALALLRRIKDGVRDAVETGAELGLDFTVRAD